MRMNKSSVRGCIVVLVIMCGRNVEGGSFTGRATDLQGINVSNVTVRVFSRQGILLNDQQMFFPSGDYNISFDDSLLPQLNQAVSIIFSAPGRFTVTLRSMLGTTDQTINVALPERPVTYRQGNKQCQPRRRCFRLRRR
jgi:hypothetical protein